MRREAIGAILGRFALVCSVMTLTVGMPALAVPTHVSLVAKEHVAQDSALRDPSARSANSHSERTQVKGASKVDDGSVRDDSAARFARSPLKNRNAKKCSVDDQPALPFTGKGARGQASSIKSGAGDSTAFGSDGGAGKNKLVGAKSKASSAEQRRIIFVGGKHRSSNGPADAYGGTATNSALNPQPIPPGKTAEVVPGLGRYSGQPSHSA